QVALEVALKGSDVDRVAGTSVYDDKTGLVDVARLAAATAPIAAYIVKHAVITGADGAACDAGAVSLVRDQDGVVARLTWACGAVAGDLIYRSTVLVDIEAAAKQVVLMGDGADAAQALLDASHTELTLTA